MLCPSPTLMAFASPVGTSPIAAARIHCDEGLTIRVFSPSDEITELLASYLAQPLLNLNPDVGEFGH
jgi:hypothetical protein